MVDESLKAELAAPLSQWLEPIQTDTWVASSLLQKAIRRGADQASQRAAFTLIASRQSSIWRRLVIIAFEDIGIASPQLVALTAMVGTDRRIRREIAEDRIVVCNLSRMLAKATKSRTAEHLVTVAKYHVSLERQRATAVERPFAGNISATVDEMVPAAERTLALLSAWNLITREPAKSLFSFRILVDAYEASGVPAELITAAELTFTRLQDPMIPATCLAWLIAKERTGVAESAIPPWLEILGIPSYAFDKHTLLGRRALRGLLKYNNSVRECFARHADVGRINDAAYMAGFYTDAASLTRKLVWQGGDELERMAIEADLMRAGVAQEGVPAVLQVLSTNIDHLNKLRAHYFFRERGFVDAATALLRDVEETR